MDVMKFKNMSEIVIFGKILHRIQILGNEITHDPCEYKLYCHCYKSNCYYTISVIANLSNYQQITEPFYTFIFIFSFKHIYKFLGLSNVLVVGQCFFKSLYLGVSVE